MATIDLTQFDFDGSAPASVVTDLTRDSDDERPAKRAKAATPDLAQLRREREARRGAPPAATARQSAGSWSGRVRSCSERAAGAGGAPRRASRSRRSCARSGVAAFARFAGGSSSESSWVRSVIVGAGAGASPFSCVRSMLAMFCATVRRTVFFGDDALRVLLVWPPRVSAVSP